MAIGNLKTETISSMLTFHLLSCVYTGRDRQRDCGATAVPQK